jgi:putative Holliday junction resolvase
MIKYPILAIDYGEKHFGLAYSDSKGLIATPLEVLHLTRRKTLENIALEILEIANEYNIQTLLIGKPQIFEKQQEETIKKISNFEDILKKHTTLPILTTDESFSTTEAQNMLLSTGQNTKSTRGKIDKISATVFLQEFLNSNNQKNGNI